MPEFPLDLHVDGNGVLGSIREDVRRGLSAPQKYLLPKYFYDAHGSDLFEQITELPEYYPTRTELSILCAAREDILRRAMPYELVEIGSGAATKVRTLLDARQDPAVPGRYVAFDVSVSPVRDAAAELLQRYPGLSVHGVIGDFDRHLQEIPPAHGRRLVLFLGSTIGNMAAPERASLLSSVRRLLQPGDHLLLGVDLVKDHAVLEAAYNDAAGVSAAFNLNALSVINAHLDADFALDDFRHRAHYNAPAARIEMHLYAERPVRVSIAALGMTVDFAAGESIWTESSYKFTQESVAAMLDAADMRLAEWYTDPQEHFGLALASPQAP